MRKGNASVWNSPFVNNWAGSSGGVIDVGYISLVNVKQSNFMKNKVNSGKGGVLVAKIGSNVSISDVIIQENSAHSCGAVLIDSSSVIEMSHSQIDRNYAGAGVGAFCVNNNSLSIVMNSSFIGNTGYHTGSVAIDHSTGYLQNCILKGNQGTTAGAIVIASADLKLSNTVFFENKAQERGDIHYETKNGKFINKFHTYRCEFKHGNVTIRSDVPNFKQIADQKHFTGHSTIFSSGLEMTETQFASSKIF